MSSLRQGCIGLFLLHMLTKSEGIRITDTPITVADPQADESAAVNYRVSAPQPKEPTNRVPAHQQSIRAGYVDDDADDVIHIIEPPQYFELLKMLAKKRMLPNNGTRQQQQQKKQQLRVTIDAPRKIPTKDQTHQASELTAIKAPPKYMKKPLFRPPNGLPLELLASVRQRQRLVHNAPRPIAMPLARERIKTQKQQTVFIEQGYAQKQFDRGQQLQLAALRSGAGQMVKKFRVRRDTEKLLVATKKQEKKNNGEAKVSSQAKLKKIKKTNKSKVAEKAGTKRYKSRSPGTLTRKRLVARNKTAKLQRASKSTAAKKRTKRQAQALKRTAKEELYQKNVLLKGNELLDHITALLKKATDYLPDSPAAENATGSETPVKRVKKAEAVENVPAEKWQRRRQYEAQHKIQPAELIGEVQATLPRHTTETEVKPHFELLKEEQIGKILANSWNVTNVIMESLSKQKNLTSTSNEPQLDDHANCRQTFSDDAMEKLSQRIDCMRQQLRQEASNATAMRLRKLFGERIREQQIAASLALNPKPGNRKVRKQRKQKQQQQKQQQQQGSSSFIFSSRVASPKLQFDDFSSLSLLYEDVMTNIRNLLQAKNLEELENELVQRDLNRKQQQQSASEDVSSPRFAAPRQLIEDASEPSDYGEFNHLNKYLSELQQIVSDFVHPVRSSSGVSTTELSLNTHEYSSSSASTPLPTSDSTNNWYLINDEGRIYQTHLAPELRPSIAVFHGFPDIPDAPVFLKNRTQLAEQATGSIELL